jgi:LysM repeat protein
MSTIRPLATIAVLAVLGLFLAWQINQPGPVALQEGWGELAPIEGAAAADEEAPPFSPTAALAAGEASATSRSAPPTTNPSPERVGVPTGDRSTSPATPSGLAPLPKLPALPTEPAPTAKPGAEGIPLEGLDPTAPLAAPLAKPAAERQASNPKPAANAALPLPALPALAAPSGSAASQPAGMPATTSAAMGGAAVTPATKPTISGRVPSLGTTTSDLPPMPTPSEAAPGATGVASSSVAPKPAAVAPSMTAPSTSTVGDRYAAVAPASVPEDAPDFGADRYAESETTPLGFGAGSTPTPRAQPAESQPKPLAAPTAGFAAAWPMIQEALARNELTRAHLMLSQWRDDPSLTLQQRNEVLSLLDQLAGTVVYSTDHLLEPPHQVAPGETLVTIAQKYGVPWSLLAKINSIATPDAVKPGQSLKVVRGPFHAQVDANSGELVLLVDGRYAGRFPANLEGVAATGGTWTVGEKAPTGLVLRSESAPGATLALGAEPTPGAAGRIAVAARDAAELNDILSVGSTVTVRR